MEWHVPYLTADLPGVGGVIRETVEDFVVEEVPAYLPAGQGEHTFFWVEKRGISTMLLVKQLAQALGCAPQAIGTAGLKDARAVARQMFSVHGIPPARVMALELERAHILWARRHPHKLRTGHLKGNRFTVRIRHVEPGAADRAAAILDRLLQRGVPNGYDAQRFGRRGDNHELGLLLLREGRAGFRRRGLRYPDPRLRRLFVSALQSALFNQYLTARLCAGTMDDLLPGDLAKKLDTGGLFVVEEVEAERPRLQRWEISPTGPIYGYKMLAAQRDAGALEADILRRADLTAEDFRRVKAKGSRRPLRYRPVGLTWTMEDATTLRLTFFAPKGSFATMLLREVMKTAKEVPCPSSDG